MKTLPSEHMARPAGSDSRAAEAGPSALPCSPAPEPTTALEVQEEAAPLLQSTLKRACRPLSATSREQQRGGAGPCREEEEEEEVEEVEEAAEEEAEEEAKAAAKAWAQSEAEAPSESAGSCWAGSSTRPEGLELLLLWRTSWQGLLTAKLAGHSTLK
jgi:hypothetical protein